MVKRFRLVVSDSLVEADLKTTQERKDKLNRRIMSAVVRRDGDKSKIPSNFFRKAN